MGVEVVAFISVWLRLYIRWTTLGGFESDDWAILAAVVSQSDVIPSLKLTSLPDSLHPLLGHWPIW
jgi:hypothetical protein